MEQSRSNLTCIIQIVQSCLSRKIKGDRREQRYRYGYRILPDIFTQRYHDNDEARMTDAERMSKQRKLGGLGVGWGPRVGFGVAPKQASINGGSRRVLQSLKRSSRGRDA